jgi:hypothetical protein
MRNPSRSSGWLVSLGGLLVAVILSVVIVCPQAVFGRKKEPVKKDDVIDALISVNIKGAVEENRRQKVGSLTIIATGKIKNESKAIGLNQYVPEGMNATYHYEYREIDLDPPRGCPPLALEEQGSGSVNVVSVMAGASDNTGAFLLQVFTGPVGKTNMLQFTKRAGPDTITHLSKEPPSDNYMFMLAPVNMKITKKERKECPQYEYDEQDNKRVFALRVPFVELKQGKMSGSYSWYSKKFPYKHLGMEVTNVRGNITYDPKKEPGDVQYQVNWVFGKVKPEIQIYQITDADIEPRDITNITKPKDILVGKKVKLEAKVIPAADPGQEGSWDIPKERVIAGFQATPEEGKVLPFKDNKNQHVEFFFVDGTPSGRNEKISYTATVDGKKIEGKTTFKVYEPSVQMETPASPTVSIDVLTDTEKGTTSCRLYLGKVGQGISGIKIKSKVHLPDPFSDQGHSLEYIQLIKEDLLEYHDADYWHYGSNDWLLDTHYPYLGLVAEGEIEMDDLPGSDLGKLHKELHQYQAFQTFLMFRPKPQDANSVWVPLKLVEWDWSASAIRNKDYSLDKPVQPSDFNLVDPRPASPKGKNWTGPTEAYPQWTENVTDKRSKDSVSDKDWQQRVSGWRKVHPKK